MLSWLAVALSGAPTRLVVLQHGLYGGASNLGVLAEDLERLCSPAGDVLVHCAAANEGRTRDGVAAGGRRLAAEVAEVAARHPSLRTLTLVGNSLGGLYARHAAAELHDERTGRMAGLEPELLLTIGCPHLGVRRYTYLPLPAPVINSAAPRLVAGQTAADLLLLDGDGADEAGGAPLLVRMSEGSFGAALRAFRRRRAYANLRGDFMVPFGTAAIETSGWGAGVNDAARARDFEAREGVVFVDRRVADGAADGVAIVCNAPAEHGPGLDGGGSEERMRRGLAACSWEKVACSFRSASTLTPFGHNRLAALRREGWRRAFEWVEQAHLGRPVIEHAARYVLGQEAA